MEKKLPTVYKLYDDYSTITRQYFVHKFDEMPSTRVTDGLYKKEASEWFLSNGYTTIYERVSPRDHKDASFTMINSANKIIVSFNLNNSKEGVYYVSVHYVYGTDIDSIIDWEKVDEFRGKKKSSVSLVITEDSNLITKDYDLVVPTIDLEMNYGSEFLKIHNSIVGRLNTANDKGIVLFHGLPGTGKTSYIRLLTNLIKDKEVLIIPPSMAETLSDPSIIPFLMDHKNSILIIEDAEKVISDRKLSGSSAGVSNILNLTDGILGDCLNIQIIATFNMERGKIDEALLRKGRLIAEHKFVELPTDDVNKLLIKLGKTSISTKPMTLADIYNIDDEVFRTEEGGTMGFRR